MGQPLLIIEEMTSHDGVIGGMHLPFGHGQSNLACPILIIGCLFKSGNPLCRVPLISAYQNVTYIHVFITMVCRLKKSVCPGSIQLGAGISLIEQTPCIPLNIFCDAC